MDDTAKEENPNLVQFLEERLPAIGLDEEAYGPSLGHLRARGTGGNY
jgi:hypothetical protein